MANRETNKQTEEVKTESLTSKQRKIKQRDKYKTEKENTKRANRQTDRKLLLASMMFDQELICLTVRRKCCIAPYECHPRI